jgi:integrase
MKKLTALKVKSATAPGVYVDGEGLMLVVKSETSRSWILRFQHDGKRRDYGMGSAAKITLAQAREKADKYRREIVNGGSPLAAKRAARTIPTFREATLLAQKKLLEAHKSDRHKQIWLGSLEAYAFPSLGSIRIDQITTSAIVACLETIWQEKPETARRVKQRILAVLDWAATREYREFVELRRIEMPKQTDTRSNFLALPNEDMPAFIASVVAAEPTIGRLALLFTIATAARSGEVRLGTIDEIDFEAKTWTIPAGRMKTKREHVVPLSDLALSALTRAQAIAGDNPKGLLFPARSGKPLSDVTMTKVLRDMKVKATVHGFRSTFKDWASEVNVWPDAASEAALAHGDPDKTRGAYRRTDFWNFRVEMMNAWADFMLGKPAKQYSKASQEEGERMAG